MVEVRLIGFGDDQPHCFNDAGRLLLDIQGAISTRELLKKSGIEEQVGLVIMSADSVIPESDWSKPLIDDGDRITIMVAIEGG